MNRPPSYDLFKLLATPRVRRKTQSCNILADTCDIISLVTDIASPHTQHQALKHESFQIKANHKARRN